MTDRTQVEPPDRTGPADLRLIDDMPRMQPGDLLAGRFVIEAYAGEGSMGAVYRAIDQKSTETVAIKVLRLTDPLNIDRFRQEAEVLAKLSHPGIVRYVAHGTTATGTLYIAMEWLDGVDLDQRLEKSGALPMEEAVLLTRRVADALGSAHQHGIVHRDIKPNNLFLPGGEIERVKILDFGIARLTRTLSHLTETGAAIGTPGYMSPEQARGEPNTDARSDIFSMGCVLFECLTGTPAFTGKTMVAVLTRILFEDSPRVRDLWREVPEELDELVARMLAREPLDRPPDGQALADTLDGLVQGDYLRIATGQSESITSETMDISPSAFKEAAAMVARRRRTKSRLTTNEQRIVSVVLAGVPADERLSERSYERVRDRLAAVRDVVTEFDGQVDHLANGSLVCVLRARGMPTEQAVTAAQCALEIRQVLPQVPLVMSTGKGVVAERLLIGEVVDRAVLLLRGVEPNHLRVDELTAGLLAARFVLQPEGPLIYLLGERDELDTPRSILGRTTDCVGRAGEMALLDSTFLACISEPAARAVLMVGPAGTGKTRLCQEFIRRLRKRGETMELLFGRGDAMRTESAYTLLAQVLRRAAGLSEHQSPEKRLSSLKLRLSHNLPADRVGEILPFVSEIVGDFPSLNDHLQLQAARQNALLMGDQIQAAWETWLAADSARHPIVIVLEDLQWADIPSVQVVSGLLRNLRGRPFMVLALARPEVDERFPQLWRDNDVTLLRLGGLSRRSSKKLVRSVLGDELPDETLDRMIVLAQGNPFYLEELMRAIQEGTDGVLPQTVLGMVQSRLDNLDSDGRRVLRAASVFGQRFWQGGLEQLLGQQLRSVSVGEWIDVLAGREIIHQRASSMFPEETEYEFRNHMVREAAYAMLTDEDRLLAHQVAGEWLEQIGERDAVVLAEHFERGAKPLRAAAWYRRAADEASEGHDFAAAISCAERGMACGASGSMLGRLLLIKADAHCWRGEYSAAEEVGLQAIDFFESGTQEWFQTVGSLILASGLQGHQAVLLRWVNELAAAEPQTMAAAQYQVVALVRAASRMLFAGRYPRAYELLTRAESQLEITGPPDPVVAGHIHRTRAYSAYFKDDLAGRLREFKEALASFEQAGDQRNTCVVRVSLGYCYVELGDYLTAESLLRDALTIAERLGLASLAATTRHNLGVALARQGLLDEARRVEAAAVEFFEQQGNQRMAGTSRIYLAEILASCGETNAALEQVSRALQILEPFPPNRAFAEARAAAIHLQTGDHQQALSHSQTGIEILVSHGKMSAGEGLLRQIHASALHRAGDEQTARAELQVALDRLSDQAAQIEDADLRRCFLKQVPENVELCALARALGLESICSDG